MNESKRTPAFVVHSPAKPVAVNAEVPESLTVRRVTPFTFAVSTTGAVPVAERLSVDAVSSDLAAMLYGVAVARVVRVSSARVAEASKLTENIFRGVNIALVNELKMIYERMGIEFHRRLHRGFAEIAKNDPRRCVVIDATLDQAAIHRRIMQVVSDRFSFQPKGAASG